MSADHYTTLGVSPAAERVAISAAYRKLMRNYHPDSNPDPEAHARAQAITAAYAILRDPAKRAKYDAELRDSDVWRSDDLPPRPARPPAGRSVGIAAAALSVLMVGAAFLLPPREEQAPTTQRGAAAKPKAGPSPAPTRPVIELEPESERLADLSGSADLKSPAMPPPEAPIQQIPTEPLPEPLTAVPKEGTMPRLRAVPPPAPIRTVRQARALPPPRPQVAQVRNLPVTTTARAKAEPKALAEASKPAPPPPAPAAVDDDRVATLQRISAGFYDQSVQHADAAKKQLLLSVRVRQTYQRAACHSNSCVADSYLRQIREVSAIMENRDSPPK